MLDSRLWKQDAGLENRWLEICLNPSTKSGISKRHLAPIGLGGPVPTLRSNTNSLRSLLGTIRIAGKEIGVLIMHISSKWKPIDYRLNHPGPSAQDPTEVLEGM
jgi:hypothetical protein